MNALLLSFWLSLGGLVSVTNMAWGEDSSCNCFQPVQEKPSRCLNGKCTKGCKMEDGYCKKKCSPGYATVSETYGIGYFDISGLNASVDKQTVPFRRGHIALELSGVSPVPGPFFKWNDGIHLQPDGYITVLNPTAEKILSGSNWILDGWIKRPKNVKNGESIVFWDFHIPRVVEGSVLLTCENKTTSAFSLTMDCSNDFCLAVQLNLVTPPFHFVNDWIRMTGIWIGNQFSIFVDGELLESLTVPPTLTFPPLVRFGTNSISQNRTFKTKSRLKSIENIAALRAFNDNGGNHLTRALFNASFHCYEITSDLLCSQCLPEFYLLNGVCHNNCPVGYQPDNATMECYTNSTEATTVIAKSYGSSGSHVVLIVSVVSCACVLFLSIGLGAGFWRWHKKRRECLKPKINSGYEVPTELINSPEINSGYEVPTELINSSREAAQFSFPSKLPGDSIDPDYTPIEENEQEMKEEDGDKRYTSIEETNHEWARHKFTSVKKRIYKEIDPDFFSDYLQTEAMIPFWRPAGTVEKLFEQMEGTRIPKIERESIELDKVLGSGEFGTVESGQWRPRRNWNVGVAVKTLKSESERDRVKFLKEAALMSQFNHQNVISLYGVVTDGDPMMIVLELMENGDIKNFLLKIKSENLDSTPVEAAGSRFLVMAKEIALGMEYLAAKSFIHRDLAARNIFLDHEFNCKIGDFGLARDLDDDYYVVSGGKIPVKWTAPEALSRRKYTSSSDVWSYGIVLYEIWSLGEAPYQGMTNREVVEKVGQGFRMEIPPSCPDYVYKLMMECWNEDHHERPSFKDIVEIFSENFDCTNEPVNSQTFTDVDGVQV